MLGRSGRVVDVLGSSGTSAPDESPKRRLGRVRVLDGSELAASIGVTCRRTKNAPR